MFGISSAIDAIMLILLLHGNLQCIWDILRSDANRLCGSVLALMFPALDPHKNIVCNQQNIVQIVSTLMSRGHVLLLVAFKDEHFQPCLIYLRIRCRPMHF